jgi:hypothetical protein
LFEGVIVNRFREERAALLWSRAIWAVMVLTTMLVAAFLWAMLQQTGGVLGAPLDDAWIHIRFARALAQGEGFSYLPGVPTPGSTAPLWTLLLAGVAVVSADSLLPAALLLSALFLLLTVWLTWRLTYALTGRMWPALLAAAGVALTGRLLWAALSGMEVTLFTALTVAALWRFHARGLDPLAVLLLGLAAQARPEAHVLFGLVWLEAAWRLLRPVSAETPLPPLWQRLRPLAVAVALYAAIQLPYALFSLSITGELLPNTFYAKSRSAVLYSERTLRETLSLHRHDNPVAFLLFWPGLLLVWWRYGRVRGGWAVAAWPALLFGLMPLIVPFVWHHGRYTLPLVPFVVMVAAIALFALWEWLPPGAGRGVAVVGAALFLLAGAQGVPRWATMLGNNAREILEIDVAMGRWLAENISADTVVAVDDIGAIMVAGPRPIVDLHGLVSPEMWPVLADPDRTAATIRLLAARDVAYMAVFPGWHPLLVSDPALATPVQRFHTATHTIIGEPEAVVYRMTWPYRREIAPEQLISADFGSAIRLRGVDLEESAEQLTLTLYWESRAPVAGSFKIFLHLLDSDQQLVAQADHWPAAGKAPTSYWQPGDLVRDPHILPLPPELPPGRYEVRVGLYTEEEGRLPVSGAPHHENGVLLTAYTR